MPPTMLKRAISLNRRNVKRDRRKVCPKHAFLAKVLFGPAHWTVAHEASLQRHGATVHELSVASGLRHETAEFILIDLHRAGLGTLAEGVYTPTAEAALNEAIDRISGGEFARRLHRALDGARGVVAHERGAPDPVEA